MKSRKRNKRLNGLFKATGIASFLYAIFVFITGYASSIALGLISIALGLMFVMMKCSEPKEES